MRTNGDDPAVTAIRILREREPVTSERTVHHLVAIVAALGCVAPLPRAARANLRGGSTSTFPAVVTVGQTGLSASIELFNQNTGPEAGMTNTVCNFQDPNTNCPDVTAFEYGINLVPSCSVLALGASYCLGAKPPLAPSGADPGVIQLSPTATGMAGTTCAGIVFNVSLYDPVFGRWQFTPQPPGTSVVLPGAGSSCVIAFTFDVLKAPAVDSDPGTPELQTIQIAENTQIGMVVGSGIFASREEGFSVMTVQRAAPTIASTTSPKIMLGGQLADTAVVSGRVAPQAGATISFQLYGPGDPTCSGPPAFASLDVDYPVAGGPVSSAPFSPTARGLYRWRAVYSGDANNAPVSGVCGETGENAVVTAPAGAPAMSAATLLGALGMLIAIAALAMARRGRRIL